MIEDLVILGCIEGTAASKGGWLPGENSVLKLLVLEEENEEVVWIW